MKSSKPKRLFSVPEGLDLDEQMIFCIGGIIVSWANCESLLRGIYEAIVGGKSYTASTHAMQAWFSHVSSHHRVGLLRKAIAGSGLTDDRKKEGLDLVRKFDRYSKRRNELAHAYYRINPLSRSLEAIEIYKTPADSAEIISDVESFSDRTVQELIEKIDLIEQLNRLLWRYLIEVRAALGSIYPMLPTLPKGYLSS